jgi:SagB-type dehydrogenase family enzyme
MQFLDDKSKAEYATTSTSYTTHPLMLICLRKIDSNRAFTIELRSSEPTFIVEETLLVWALTALPAVFTRAEAEAVWSREERAAGIINEIWEYVTGEGLVLPVKEAQEINRRCEIWNQIGGTNAGIYHEATRDYPFVDMSRKDAFLADNARMKNYEESGTAPSVYQSFNAIQSVPLEKVTANFASYIGGDARHKIKDLSLIFDFCFGERIKLEHAFDEQEFLQLESLRKAIPSGGGRHPTEVFITIFDQEQIGLPPGLYHYNVQGNKLDLLRGGELYEELHAVLGSIDQLDANGAGRPGALMFFTSLCERAMWRYRDPRSWRAYLIDIGHVEFMCSQVCASLGYSLKFSHGQNSPEAARFLAIDPYTQPVMALATLSTQSLPNHPSIKGLLGKSTN